MKVLYFKVRRVCFRQVFILTALTFVIVANDCFAQQRRSVKGRVTVAPGGEVLPGASVLIKGTTEGTMVDTEGNYILHYTTQNPVIQVSFLGYKTHEEPIDNRAVINVELEEDVTKIDEVVVVAMGSQRKESVVGAISTLKVDNLVLPTVKLSTSLAGQLAGIISVQRNGEPGSGASFWIRGLSTFGANQSPLVLVDGVERSLDLVDIEDVDTFSILKDASATAVYGVRGANGVIVITTKQGYEGRPQINLRYELGMLTPMKRAKMVDSYQFADLVNESVGRKVYSDEAMRQFQMPHDAPGRDHNLYPNVDWIDRLFSRWANNQRVNLSVSGGGNIARYYVSGAYYNEGSIFRITQSDYDNSVKYDRMNFRANVDLNITPVTVLGIKISNVFEQFNEPGSGRGGVWTSAFETSPAAFPEYYTDNEGNWLAWSGPTLSGGFNPYNLLMNSGYKQHFWNQTQTTISLTQKFGNAVPGLSAVINFSWDAWNSSWIARSKSVDTHLARPTRDDKGELILDRTVTGSNSLGYQTGRGNDGATNYLEALLRYQTKIGDKHNLSALFNYNQKILTYVSASDAEGSLPYKNQGVAARFTYDYENRYFMEFNAGYNGSENFAPGKRFGLFPAIAGGWIVSNEKFMESLSNVISFLKLRASWGKIGNDKIGGGRRFIYDGTIVGAGGYTWGKMGDSGSNGIAIGEFANPDVSWEEAIKTNVGLEVNFLDNQLKLTGEYFYEQRKGIFMKRAALPGIAGVPSVPWVNVGAMSNSGFEGSLEFYKRVGEVNFAARGNFTYARNTLLNNDQPDWKYKYLNRIGKPWGQPFGLIAEGFFKDQADIDNSPVQAFSPVRVGDVKYRDINADGKIDENDEVAIGYPSMPQIVYGFGISAQWKGLSLSLFFQGIANSSLFIHGDAIKLVLQRPSTSRVNIFEDVYNRVWRPSNEDNSDAIYPRISAGAIQANNNRTSTLWMRDRSFIRLKNAEVAYNLPQQWTKAIGLKNIRTYISGTNLLTFSKFDLWDPENGGGSGAAYPLNTTFSLGIQFTY